MANARKASRSCLLGSINFGTSDVSIGWAKRKFSDNLNSKK